MPLIYFLFVDNFNYMKNFLSLKNITLSIFVIILWPLFFIKIILRKIFIRNTNKRILVINNAKIGDVVCATPVFRAIKEKYPKSYLCVLVTYKTKDILLNNKNIDKIIPYALNDDFSFFNFIKLFLLIKKENFDISINMIPGTINLLLPFFCAIPLRITAFVKEYGDFYKFLTFLLTNKKSLFINDTYSIKNNLSLLEFICIYNNNYKKEVCLDEVSNKSVEEFLSLNNVNKNDILVGISLSAGNKIKQWDVVKFFNLIELIIQKYNFKIIIIGSGADKHLFDEIKNYAVDFNNSIIYCDKLSLRELPSLMNYLSYFISVDTGPVYIANALNVPVLDIVGPCSINDQVPVDDKCEIIYNKDLDCWPCSNVLFPAKNCKNGHLKCLKEINPELVLKSFDFLVKRYGK